MTTIDRGPTLADWGEFRIINEIILPLVRKAGPPKPLGDDCAFLPLITESGDELVVTTDVGPKPLCWHLGLESYWSWGWYSVVVNLSDIASSGASAIAFANSIDAPSTLPVHHLKEFFEGMIAACIAYNVTNAGGNVRAAEKFACHGMAIGVVGPGAKIGRDGCMATDRVVAIGECGQFMAAFVSNRSTGTTNLSEKEIEILTKPIPRLREMALLRKAGLVSAATDNSDGILGALWNIAEKSACAFELNIDESKILPEVRRASIKSGVKLLNLFLCWGDWQIIATIPASRFADFEELCSIESINFTELGYAFTGKPTVVHLVDGTRKPLRIVRNENFNPTSFNATLDSHLDYMLKTDLYEVLSDADSSKE